MRSMFAILSVLSALVVLSSAHPTSSGFVDIKPRCESCADACPKTHFYYSRKKCCLPTGGPPTPVAAPATISCPSKWWYHPTQKCCVPKLPDASANPTCSSTVFSHWNPTSQCCEKPTPAPVVNTNCEKNHFFYGPKSCCLPTGGPTKLPPTPGSLGCPATWYYHSGKKCCVPKYPNPSPKPTCSSSTYPKWNPGRHCCENPTPVTPGRPQVSNLKRHAGARPASQHKAKKNRTIAVEVPSCPSPLEVCPISGAAFDQYECIDPVADVRACGGCPALGRGDDCTQILNSLNVSCRQSTSLTVSSCYVESCQAGFVPSKDHGSCVPLLQTSPQ